MATLREIQSPTGLHYWIHETPEDLAVLTPRVAQESEIWIDTETADWNTTSPRLPLRSLRLAALVQHLCGTALDKTWQRADWGQRPLSAEQLDYAAWDPEWCYRVHRRLDPLVRAWDPAAENPVALQGRYVEVLPAERDASRWRTAMWDATKAFMMSGSHERFAAFVLQTRVVRKVPIRV